MDGRSRCRARRAAERRPERRPSTSAYVAMQVAATDTTMMSLGSEQAGSTVQGAVGDDVDVPVGSGHIVRVLLTGTMVPGQGE